MSHTHVEVCLWDQHTLHSYIVASQCKAQLLKTMFVTVSAAYSITSLSINLKSGKTYL